MAPFTKLLPVALPLLLLAGCGGSARPDPPVPAPLSADNTNLIFVVSEDLAFHASGDINSQTANLTNQGLQRSLQLGTFLKQNVLGGENVSRIYALEPTTHLQTAGQHPDMVAFATVQQFAMLNQTSMSRVGLGSYVANSFPLNVSYGSSPVPTGVVTPFLDCASCQGLDFKDQNGDNETLVSTMIKASQPGFYVFSAPWETTSSLLANINQQEGYNLNLPVTYVGPNYVYAISITPAGSAALISYNSNLNPPSSYPVLPAPVVGAACNGQTHFNITVTGGQGGAVVPAGANTNETVYLIRHAEAHPKSWYEDGNYVAAGQWRALDLPYALRGKISPNLVYSIDPAQVTPGSESSWGDSSWSYVRTCLTVEPYAIANNLPFDLAAGFSLIAQNPPQLATQASDFFFTGGKFSNQTVLVDWEHDHIPPTVNALLASYHGNNQSAPNWPDPDYDTIWTVKLDAHGNVTVDNALCEGIDSTKLPPTAPQF